MKPHAVILVVLQDNKTAIGGKETKEEFTMKKILILACFIVIASISTAFAGDTVFLTTADGDITCSSANITKKTWGDTTYTSTRIYCVHTPPKEYQETVIVDLDLLTRSTRIIDGKEIVLCNGDGIDDHNILNVSLDGIQITDHHGSIFYPLAIDNAIATRTPAAHSLYYTASDIVVPPVLHNSLQGLLCLKR